VISTAWSNCSVSLASDASNWIARNMQAAPATAAHRADTPRRRRRWPPVHSFMATARPDAAVRRVSTSARPVLSARMGRGTASAASVRSERVAPRRVRAQRRWHVPRAPRGRTARCTAQRPAGPAHLAPSVPMAGRSIRSHAFCARSR
jgi:hypothetical protein